MGAASVVISWGLRHGTWGRGGSRSRGPPSHSGYERGGPDSTTWGSEPSSSLLWLWPSRPRRHKSERQVQERRLVQQADGVPQVVPQEAQVRLGSDDVSALTSVREPANRRSQSMRSRWDEGEGEVTVSFTKLSHAPTGIAGSPISRAWEQPARTSPARSRRSEPGSPWLGIRFSELSSQDSNLRTRISKLDLSVSSSFGSSVSLCFFATFGVARCAAAGWPGPVPVPAAVAMSAASCWSTRSGSALRPPKT